MEVLAFLLCLSLSTSSYYTVFSTPSLGLLLSRFPLILMLPHLIATSLPSSHLIHATTWYMVNHFLLLKTLFLWLGDHHILLFCFIFLKILHWPFFSQSPFLTLHPLLDRSNFRILRFRASVSSLSLP